MIISDGKNRNIGEVIIYVGNDIKYDIMDKKDGIKLLEYCNRSERKTVSIITV